MDYKLFCTVDRLFRLCGILFFYGTGKIPIGDLFKVNHKYMLLGGVIGAFITFTVIKSMSSLGPAQAILAIVITQVLVGYLIEMFGLFGVEKVPFAISKCIGMIVAVVGLIIFKWEW